MLKADLGTSKGNKKEVGSRPFCDKVVDSHPYCDLCHFKGGSLGITSGLKLRSPREHVTDMISKLGKSRGIQTRSKSGRKALVRSCLGETQGEAEWEEANGRHVTQLKVKLFESWEANRHVQYIIC